MLFSKISITELYDAEKLLLLECISEKYIRSCDVTMAGYLMMSLLCFQVDKVPLQQRCFGIVLLITNARSMLCIEMTGTRRVPEVLRIKLTSDVQVQGQVMVQGQKLVDRRRQALGHRPSATHNLCGPSLR